MAAGTGAAAYVAGSIAGRGRRQNAGGVGSETLLPSGRQFVHPISRVSVDTHQCVPPVGKRVNTGKLAGNHHVEEYGRVVPRQLRSRVGCSRDHPRFANRPS
jgi:hypothetical protein